MKRSVILTDRLGPDILLVLTMKRQVLHCERVHLKVPGCSDLYNCSSGALYCFFKQPDDGINSPKWKS